MDLLQIFYLLGIIYFAISLFVLLVILTLGVLVFLKLRKLKQSIPQKLEIFTSLIFLIGNKKTRKLFPFFAIIPLVINSIKSITGRKHK